MSRVFTTPTISADFAPPPIQVAWRRRLATIGCLAIALLLGAPPTRGQDSDEPVDEAPGLNAALVSGLRFRNLGPALMSGRISDIAVDPVHRSTWYVAVASGGVFKTQNAGTTWTPIFDSYGSYSIGCVAIDPNNRHVIWVGTGENNSQRSVGYGDGVYKSLDGGKSFTRVGLEDSEHIGKIVIHPDNSDIVYVAAQGPLWKSGGQRGLYKTVDGGQSWDCVLEISPDTGVNEVLLDPRDPQTVYASSYQRRRHVWTLLDGGPESGIHKSTDGGKSWRAVRRGLPGVDLGRIGLAISPTHPDVLYAIVEAAKGQSGFYRSADRGETWTRQSDYTSSSGQYYQEIVADPHAFDRVYSLDTLMHVSEDGGATFQRLGEQFKHVDNHAMHIDPTDADHLIIGCDGGLYETWDRGRSYRFCANLPITQFYKIAVSNDEPFYFVYGGTQDNATQGGPSRTRNVHGIRNSDWFVTVFGDGFGPAVDPLEPHFVYSQWQYGGLVRFDRRTGLRIDIKPREAKGGPPLRWNWDSALMISPHSNTRLYYGAQMLFRSDDRGDSWAAVSPDLTRNLDRNKLKVMGRVWGVDAVAKNASTSFYGSIVAVSESPLVSGLLYVGTDDGLVQISENAGETWTQVDRFEHLDVPQFAYVNDIEASVHDADTVFVALNHHKRGDFQPYLVRSDDRGKSWVDISGDLPQRGSVYCVQQDHVNPNLLFVGTEFGVFVSLDGGTKWIPLGGGLPTIAVRDMVIQRRENDLVLGTFGRGFYVLDDYSPLRELTPELVERDAHVFAVKKAPLFLPDAPLALDGKAFQGAGFFTAPNPPLGVAITYYLKEGLQSREAARRKKESALDRAGKDAPYPSWEELKAEDREEPPAVLLTIRDDAGDVVRRLSGPVSKGLHRVHWEFRYPGFEPVSLSRESDGPLALPGEYTVTLSKFVDGEYEELTDKIPFEIETLGFQSLDQEQRRQELAFQRETGELQRTVLGAYAALQAAQEQVRYMKRAIETTPQVNPGLRKEARQLELRVLDVLERFEGDPTKPNRNEPGEPGILSRVRTVVFGHWYTTDGPTQTHRASYGVAKDEYLETVGELRRLLERDIPALGRKLDEANAPWTPGRKLPSWKESLGSQG